MTGEASIPTHPPHELMITMQTFEAWKPLARRCMHAALPAIVPSTQSSSIGFFFFFFLTGHSVRRISAKFGFVCSILYIYSNKVLVFMCKHKCSLSLSSQYVERDGRWKHKNNPSTTSGCCNKAIARSHTAARFLPSASSLTATHNGRQPSRTSLLSTYTNVLNICGQ